MDPADRATLEKNLSELVRLISDGNALLDNLYSRRGIFSSDMYLDRKRELDEDARQGLCSLIMTLTKRGPKAFDAFVEALVETGHFDAAQLLKPEIDVLSLSHDLNLRGLGRSSLSAPNLMRQRTLSAPNHPFRVLQLVNDLQAPPAEDYDALPIGPGAPAASTGENTVTSNVVRPDRPLRVYCIKKAEKFVERSSVYPMTKNPRGYVLLINNEDFHLEELTRRTGSQYDCDALRSVFQQLHFIVEDHLNKGYSDMKRIIRDFAAKPEHFEADACFVIVMSHGNSDKGRDYVYSWDHRELEMSWIHEQFNNVNAPGLIDKPKVFIYQCCRGDVPDCGVRQAVRQGPSMIHFGLETDSASFAPVVRKIPTFSDMLLVFATVPGYASFRQKEAGTWFIQTLCEMLEEHAADVDFHEIVNCKVAERLMELESSRGEKQTPEVASRGFTKKLFLNPGLFEDPDDLMEPPMAPL